MAKRKAVTRRDVAELAGVAPPTVSIILNNTPGTRITDSTRERVIAAAQKLGYRPNPAARALATGKSGNLGVTLHFEQQPFSGFTTKILDSFWETTRQRNYRCILGLGKAEASLDGLYSSKLAEGFLIYACPNEVQSEEFLDALDQDFPIIFVGAKPDHPNACYIDIDNFEAGKQATERLIRSGAKRILHIAGPIDINSSAQDRFEGYQAALNDAGIAFDQDLVIRADYQVQMAKEEFQQYYSDKGLCFDGIFAANHGMCLAAMEILLADEVSFPGQVQMTSIDKHKPEPYLEYPNITRVTMPLKTIGREAANLLLDKIDGKRIPLRSYYDFNWIEGETTKKVGG